MTYNAIICHYYIFFDILLLQCHQLTGKSTIVKFQHILTVIFNLKAKRNFVASSKRILTRGRRILLTTDTFFLPHAFMPSCLCIYQYASGIKKRLTTVPSDIPPIRARAIGRCNFEVLLLLRRIKPNAFPSRLIYYRHSGQSSIVTSDVKFRFIKGKIDLSLYILRI